MSGEILVHRLLSLHNLIHLCRLMAQAREAIREGRFDRLRESVDGRLAAGAG
jgi:tRNA-guanine family transglycosylase